MGSTSSRSARPGPRAGVDVGGTFTDVVIVNNDGGLTIAKLPSTTDDQSVGVLDGLQETGVPLGTLGEIAHGMTIATNALLERSGARTALVTTAGFRDVIEIARQNRSATYDLAMPRPAPLVPRELRFTVRERMGPDGVVVPLDEDCVQEVIAALRKVEAEAVAVCLLFGFLHPQHEQRVGAMLRDALPGVHLSLSSEVLPEFREYERASTVTADAYVRPRLVSYLQGLAERLAEAGAPAPLVMQSSGGVTNIGGAIERSAACALSGPAGGVVGAAYVGAQSYLGDLLTFDMGGTSTDVSVVIDGEVQITTENVVAGIPIRFPMIDVHTISAGGGSIAWVDDGDALRIGPRSAGARPGPVAYGHGGTQLTVTDANHLLGYLASDAVLGGTVALHVERVRERFAELAERLGMPDTDCALGIVTLADAEMTRALRRITVERGLDPRDFTLVAFGGAGPLHALAVAEELGVARVAIPRACGVLSALGLAICDLRRDYLRPLHQPLEQIDAPATEATFAALEQRAAEELEEATCTRLIDVRYRGQSFELTVEAGTASETAARFHARHRQLYGFDMADQPLVLINVRIAATSRREAPVLRERKRPAVPPRHRRIYLEGAWMEVPVLDRTALGTGARVEGPAIVDFPEAACLVRPAWSGAVDKVGTLVLERR